MRSTRRRVLAAVAASASLAGCLGGGGADPTTNPGGTGTDPATDTPAETGTQSSGEGNPAPTVRVRSHPDLGELLAGPDGMTLYMFDSDTEGAGASSCYDGCANAWPPLTVDGEPTAGDAVTAELTTFERDDGATQVAAAGWPLYYFASDEQPGDAGGQGVNDVWWVLQPDGTPVRAGTATSTATETDDGGVY